MALLSVIRRWHFREEIPIREIERRTELSRNTIRKYLRSGAVEPKFKVSDRPSNLDAFAEKLAAWLRVEVAKSRKQRRTARQMHTGLVSLGYRGSYSRVAAFVRGWKAERQRNAQTSGRGIFVPLAIAPGEAFQFDWSEDWAVLGGERVKLQVAHTKLSNSRAFIVRAYPHRSGAHFRRELIRRLARHGSFLSRVGASGKPGAIQPGFVPSLTTGAVEA